MRKTNIVPVDVESEFSSDELFFSTTCPKGIIRSCNDVFMRVSEYEPADLLGQPHNTVRHPDMPKCVFNLFWSYLLEGRTIGAYVKNMSRTGKYYWVFALTTPLPDGYLSIRIKPSSPIFEAARELYAELLQHEKSFGADWRRGMKSARELMLEKVTELGFDSYDDLMSQALQQELTQRAKLQRHAGVRQLAELKKIKTLRGSRDQLWDKKLYFSELGPVVRLVALNSRVATTQLSERGRALGSISERISSASDDITAESETITEAITGLRDTLHEASFLSSFRLLQKEMRSLTALLARKTEYSIEEQSERFGASFEDARDMLGKSLTGTDEVCRTQFEALTRSLRTFGFSADNLLKALLTIQMGYVTGRTVAIGIEGAERFTLRLDQVADLSTSARAELAAMGEVVESLRVSAEALTVPAEQALAS
ncbi:MAG: PAS domain-containing protein [Sandaracinaceae bacterium]